MDYIRVTRENIEKEHICCAISNNNDVQVSSVMIGKEGARDHAVSSKFSFNEMIGPF